MLIDGVGSTQLDGGFVVVLPDLLRRSASCAAGVYVYRRVWTSRGDALRCMRYPCWRLVFEMFVVVGLEWELRVGVVVEDYGKETTFGKQKMQMPVNWSIDAVTPKVGLVGWRWWYSGGGWKGAARAASSTCPCGVEQKSWNVGRGEGWEGGTLSSIFPRSGNTVGMYLLTRSTC